MKGASRQGSSSATEGRRGEPDAEPLVDLARRLFPFDYSVVGPGNDTAAGVLGAALPFRIFEYRSGSELNGWTIPPACMVEKAEIRKDGQLILDGTKRPLCIPALSDSFVGRLSLGELKEHLYCDPMDKDATPYHWMRLYRPNEPIWGFCVPKTFMEGLSDGQYDIELVTLLQPGMMKVFLHELPGDTDTVVLFNAHNCHPYQANDDISGIVVGVELMRRLSQLPRRRFTYMLMVAPELFGPMFWLDEIGIDGASRIKGTVMLKSVGNDRPLRLQQSYHGGSSLDLAAHNVFRSSYGTYESGEFRAIYGNDETVFEAPPYAIPSISLTRWPFAGYHTDKDTCDRLCENRLEETVATSLEICRALEMDTQVTYTAQGLVCLSRYGLYKPLPALGENGVDYSTEAGRWNRLMNTLPRMLDGKSGLLEIAEHYRLPVGEVHEYVQAWIAKCIAK
jgi:aminopeptidase-like protein